MTLWLMVLVVAVLVLVTAWFVLRSGRGPHGIPGQVSRWSISMT